MQCDVKHVLDNLKTDWQLKTAKRGIINKRIGCGMLTADFLARVQTIPKPFEDADSSSLGI